MKIFIFVFLLLTINFSFANNWAKVYKSKKNNIPMIFSRGGICSGAFVSQTQVLTAAHCVWNLRPTFVVLDNDHSKKIPARTIKINQKEDLALLELEEKQLVQPFNVTSILTPLFPGQEIATIGHPTRGTLNSHIAIDFDSTYLLSTGIVSKVTQSDIISDMSISPGNSGGPVLNSNGEIVGVVSRKRVDRFVGNIGYLPHHVAINRLLKNKRQDYGFFDAKGSFNLGILFNSHSYFAKIDGVDSSLQSLDLKLNAWDRVTFEFEGGLTDKNLGYYLYAVGYKFLFHFENQSIMNLFLTAGILDYSHPKTLEVARIDQQNPAYSIEFNWSLFPLTFKYTATTIEDNPEKVLSLGFYLIN